MILLAGPGFILAGSGRAMACGHVPDDGVEGRLI
jgi:hypothetical protein